MGIPNLRHWRLRSYAEDLKNLNFLGQDMETSSGERRIAMEKLYSFSHDHGSVGKCRKYHWRCSHFSLNHDLWEGGQWYFQICTSHMLHVYGIFTFTLTIYMFKANVGTCSIYTPVN